jgi:putative hydrolase of the HAD superfamily
MVRAGVDAAATQRVARNFRESFLDLRRWHLLSDTVAALTDAKGHGWVNVVLSNHVPEREQLVRPRRRLRHWAQLEIFV